MKTGFESERNTAKNCFYPIYLSNGTITKFGEVPNDDFHPESAVVKLSDGEMELWPISSEGKERKWRYARQTIEQIADQLEIKSGRSEIPVIYLRKEVESYRTVWDDAIFNAAEYGSTLLKNIVPGTEFSFPKSIWTVLHSLKVSNPSKNDTVLDYFAGSGTTGHAVINLNREDGGKRKFILVEMADYFDTVLLPRLKEVTFTPEWKDGKPKRLASAEEAERSPRMFKVIRLESYEDTLNNLELRRTREQEDTLFSSEAQGPGKLKEQYMLNYMLDVESRGSQPLLNIDAFKDPLSYKLKVKRPGSDESQDTTVDLMETFNWLIGLTVKEMSAPQCFDASFERDSEHRLTLKGWLRPVPNGRWWIRAIRGTLPDDNQEALIIWRNLPGNPEEDNLVFDEWFKKSAYSTKESLPNYIYVNGTNNLENVRLPDATWKVRLIEEDFQKLMFEIEEGL
jgi:adenine-specific DNA-methyltransferase